MWGKRMLGKSQQTRGYNNSVLTKVVVNMVTVGADLDVEGVG